MFSLLIKLIVLLLPTQLGIHFWPAFSRVAGIKVDYLSPTLYLIDPLLILLVISNISPLVHFLKKHLFFVGILILFIILNIIFSVSPLNSLFWWLRMDLYLLVFCTLRLRHLKWEDIKTPLLIGSLGIVLIEITQVIIQSSIGGIFYFLGERAYSVNTPGIARMNLLGLEFLRPISTFSHPNSLAGYLLVVFYLFMIKPSKVWHKLIPFIGIILSFSKAAILYLALLIFNFRPEIIILFSLIISLTQPLIQNWGFYWQPLSDRLFYYSYLNKIISSSPAFGVGLGGFIPSLGNYLPGSFLTPSKLQPVHNLLFLMVAELGISGTILLILFFIRVEIRKIILKSPVLGLIALVLFTGSFDHYFWTLSQNKLIVMLALAILF